MSEQKNASKKQEKKSKPGFALQDGEPLLDFLYVDRDRIALFLSQFDAYGFITSLSKSVTTGSVSGGGMDVKLVKIEGSDSEQTSVSKQYDPRWLAPLVFLDHVQDGDHLKRDLATARVGQIVSVSGVPSIADLVVMRTLFETSQIKELLTKVAAKQGKDGDKTVPVVVSETETVEVTQTSQSQRDLLMTIMASMPYPIQLTLESAGGKLWGTLDPNFLISSVTDIMLKYGQKLSGEWTVIGILDAIPDPSAAPPEQPKKPEVGPGKPIIPKQHLMHAVETVAVMGRRMIGRPSTEFGITPLLIYRAVSS